MHLASSFLLDGNKRDGPPLLTWIYFCKVMRVVRIGRRPEHRFEMRSFNMQTPHSRDIWPAFNPLKPVGKDGIRSRLPDVFYQWLQLSSPSCTEDVFIRLQDAPRTIANWPQVRYIAIWTKHTRELNIWEKHSTELALICLIEKIISAIERNEFTVAVFLDLSKAFDMVDHQILLKKLEHYGIRGVPLKWLSSYLSGRQQYVNFQNTDSDKILLNAVYHKVQFLGHYCFLFSLITCIMFQVCLVIYYLQTILICLSVELISNRYLK